MQSKLFIALLMLAALVAVVRVYMTVRRVRQDKSEDWDEGLVKNLRTQGGERREQRPQRKPALRRKSLAKWPTR